MTIWARLCEEGFREVPGFPGFAVSRTGVVVNLARAQRVGPFAIGGVDYVKLTDVTGKTRSLRPAAIARLAGFRPPRKSCPNCGLRHDDSSGCIDQSFP